MAASLGLACTPQRPARAPERPPLHLTLHTDSGFSAEELNYLHSAAIRLNVQTQGAVTVTLSDGLDPVQFWTPPGDWRLLRILDADSLTMRFDMRNARGVPEPIVGICVRAGRDVYIVPDRIRTANQFVSVAMHEMLHALGLEHTDAGSRNVMSEQVGDIPPVALTPADRAELDRVRNLPIGAP